MKSLAFTDKARHLIRWLAQPGIAFYALPALMALLTVGTIAQRYIGLYDSQKLFFSSFITWLGPIPLPGGYALMAFISISLLAKFLFHSDWRMNKAGINLSHLGILVLLIGGLLTATQAKEGFMVIPEGTASTYVSDYHQREMVITKDGNTITAVPHQAIDSEKTLRFDNIPFSFRFETVCRNCAIKKRTDATEDYGQPFKEMAQFMALYPDKPGKDEETNLYGATFTINEANEKIDGTYIIFDVMPKPIRLETDHGVYEIIYRKQQRTLPFAIRLQDFVKQTHPGTNMPSTYHADVIVEDGSAEWPVRIEMNKPLRYKGYTFFQSSFAENETGEATVLTVVKNSGWIFPYISTAIVTLGLLLHILIMAAKRRAAR